MIKLTEPNPNARAHSEALQQQIIQTIRKQNGSISFAKFMDMALYARDLGYYVNDKPKLGATGDFITAPEQYPLFTHTLAHQCAQILSSLPKPRTLLEFGPGSGKMAVELLRILESVDCLPEKYDFVELSPILKQKQQAYIAEQLPHLFDRCTWLTQFPAGSFQGLVLANEVVDAMPVHRFIQLEDKLWELCVQESAGKFELHPAPPSDPLLENSLNSLFLQHREAFCEQYQSEVNLLAPAWLASIAQALTRGMVLIVDYGFNAKEYYHPQRHMGTLMCHYQHLAHEDAFFYPGLQDITAHVDFSSLANHAKLCGFEVNGYTTMGLFLLGAGIEKHYNQLHLREEQTDTFGQFRLNQQLKCLTMPHEMGELFKVLALSKDMSIALNGFSISNKIHSL